MYVKHLLLMHHVLILTYNQFALSIYCFLQVTLCNVTPVWAPIMMTATDKAPNLVPATRMPVLRWWAMTVSPTETVE